MAPADMWALVVATVVVVAPGAGLLAALRVRRPLWWIALPVPASVGVATVTAMACAVLGLPFGPPALGLVTLALAGVGVRSLLRSTTARPTPSASPASTGAPDVAGGAGRTVVVPGEVPAVSGPGLSAAPCGDVGSTAVGEGSEPAGPGLAERRSVARLGARVRERGWSSVGLDRLPGLVLVAAGVGLGLLVWVYGLGGMGTLGQEHDLIVHGVLTAYIQETGHGAPWQLLPADVLTGDGVTFYPAGLHLLMAVTAAITGSTVVGINAVSAVVLGAGWTSGSAALAHVAARRARCEPALALVAAGIASIVAAGLYRPTIALAQWGGTIPNAVTLALTPGLLAALLTLPTSPRPSTLPARLVLRRPATPTSPDQPSPTPAPAAGHAFALPRCSSRPTVPASPVVDLARGRRRPRTLLLRIFGRSATVPSGPTSSAVGPALGLRCLASRMVRSMRRAPGLGALVPAPSHPRTGVPGFGVATAGPLAGAVAAVGVASGPAVESAATAVEGERSVGVVLAAPRGWARRGGGRAGEGARAAVVIGVAVAGMLAIHPSAVVTVGVSLAAWWVGEALGADGRRRLVGQAVPLAVAGVVTVAVSAPMLLAMSRVAANIDAFRPDIDPVSFGDALDRTLRLTYNVGDPRQKLATAQAAAGGLAILGAVVLAATRRGVGAVTAWLGWVALVVATWVRPGGGLPGMLTNVFYDAQIRVWSHASLLVPTLAGAGLAILAGTLPVGRAARARRTEPTSRRWWVPAWSRHAGSAGPARGGRRGAAILVATALGLAYLVGPGYRYGRSSVEGLATRYARPEYTRFSAGDERAVDWLADHVAPGERVLNSANDGSSLLYVERRVPIVNVASLGSTAEPDGYRLLQAVDRYPVDGEVRRMLRELDIRWIYVDMSAPTISASGAPEAWAGDWLSVPDGFVRLTALARTSGLPGLEPRFRSGPVTVYHLDPAALADP